jgi:hypothetical protein
MRNAYKITIGNREKRDHMRDLEIDGRTLSGI